MSEEIYEAAPLTPPNRRGGGRAMNALKHGLTSRSPVAGGEDESDWLRFRRVIFEIRAPKNLEEYGAVEEIAEAQWLRSRARKYGNDTIDQFYLAASGFSTRETMDEKILNEIDCDLLGGLQFLEEMSDVDDSEILDVATVQNALYLPRVLGTNAPTPDWLVSPKPGDKWTTADLDRWFEALAKHLGTTAAELKDRTITKAKEILRAKRLRSSASHTPERGFLLGYTDPFETAQRWETKRDRELDRAINHFERIRARTKQGKSA